MKNTCWLVKPGPQSSAVVPLRSLHSSCHEVVAGKLITPFTFSQVQHHESSMPCSPLPVTFSAILSSERPASVISSIAFVPLQNKDHIYHITSHHPMNSTSLAVTLSERPASFNTAWAVSTQSGQASTHTMRPPGGRVEAIVTAL